MLSYILLVAVLNVGLGFVLAAHLGRRYRLLTALPLPIAAPALNESPRLPTAAIAAAPALPKEARDTGLPLPPESAPPPQQTAGEKSVTALRQQTSQYEEQVAQANDALRSYTGVAEAAAIEACLSSLVEATNEYLRHREELQKGFQRLPAEQPKLQEIHAKVQVAIERQEAHIQSTSDSIAKFNYQDDPEAGCMRVVGETNKLMDANHQLRDTLDAALVEVARDQQRLHLMDRSAETDPLTGIAGRAALESQLSRWWQDDPQHARRLGVAMIDIDRFTEINQQFGHKTGDQVLRAIGQLLLAERGGEGTAARFTGQCFVLLFPDADLRQVANAVERIRQLVDLAHFRHRDEELRLTVSCAVTETSAEDTTETLLARAEEALREAKRYGRNRTFLYEGKYPTPVVPPSFSLTEKEITL